MTRVYELDTDRLRLRQWQSSDYPEFAGMSACSEVMKYFPSTLSETESDALATRLSELIADRGWGLWAVEEKQHRSFLGFTGLHQAPEELSFSPAIEIGWRFSRQSWGRGYATEAANRVLRFAFEELELAEVVSFTSVVNERSQAVMRRIGMRDSNTNFGHPRVSADSDLHEHVLYRITYEQWREIA